MRERGSPTTVDSVSIWDGRDILDLIDLLTLASNRFRSRFSDYEVGSPQDGKRFTARNVRGNNPADEPSATPV